MGCSSHPCCEPSVQDPQPGFVCSVSPWEKGNVGILAQGLGWWELQKRCITQAATSSAAWRSVTAWRDPRTPSLPGKGHAPAEPCQPHREQPWA